MRLVRLPSCRCFDCGDYPRAAIIGDAWRLVCHGVLLATGDGGVRIAQAVWESMQRERWAETRLAPLPDAEEGHKCPTLN